MTDSLAKIQRNLLATVQVLNIWSITEFNVSWQEHSESAGIITFCEQFLTLVQDIPLCYEFNNKICMYSVEHSNVLLH